MKKIAPSILSADFSRLGEDVKMIDEAGAEYVHIDVMDGMFVPNISFGLPVIKAIRNVTERVFDVHLMIEDPGRYIDEFADAGADIITVHYEATVHLHRVVQQIKNRGLKAGVSLNPSTPVMLLKDIIKDLDLVLIMSVNPGFGGQSFIEGAKDKVIELVELRDKYNKELLIEIDGGVKEANIGEISCWGVDVFVAGSEVFKADNPAEKIKRLKEIVNA
ncbi:ribulose-phosphate 3-epimerase [Dethiosulfatibacter aminovorans DSM 17477]|uniref:Ribulose-phosphate 3-epimerase n=1 Tax=Dethiosulfatibacter aminovorans DSM 17477 TaxID=1121476 RepID=A0A1M6DI95_9FIRM|nr:ribulose-phosphate 3-epimerase [Dethiosulfatibacter aminovorans]SHI72890.1 ribulose-phosphate 3-epimerase [Dethiosulfatibacter aminovorans DSM 17477]